ncbi:MAG: hypothetical protein ABW252_25170 [Polyangiales bacterium]
MSAPLASALRYQAQRAYVATMFAVLGRLLIAGAGADPEIRRELSAFPEGTRIGFSIVGDATVLRLVWRGDLLHVAPARADKPDVEIVFKHVAHAFALLSFQESTPIAYARDRMSTHGDVGLTVRFVRCLTRVQAVMLPGAIASRALKSVPAQPVLPRLGLATRIAGGVVRSLLSRTS